MKNKIKIAEFLLACIAAIILLQTLYFKFSAHPDSVYIFGKLGVEPLGRIMSGIAELLASVLLLIPALRWIGALLSAAIMAAAILSHIFVLGIEIMNDGGMLFLLALFTFACSCGILLINKNKFREPLKHIWN